MLEGQPLLSVHHSLLVYQKSGNEFQLGYFDRFVHGHGEICSRSGLRYIFGPESVDLGPCCDPCDEDWIRILKNEDALFFSEGYTHSCGNEFVRTAKQVTIPGTYNDSGFLGVVLRERHPSSTEGATAAFLCPPFGIIKLHKFCFGCDPNVSWPPVVGARFWVLLNKGGGSARVQKVNGRADGDKFGHGSTKALINIPKLHLWQWNKTFNQSGIFEITDFILKNTVEARSVSTEIVRRKWQDKSSASASRGIQEYEEEETSAAISLLLEILNDQDIRDLVIERHRKAFENYINEISRF